MIHYLCYCGRGGRETQGLLISINLRDGSEAFQAKHFCLFRCRQRAYFSSPSVIPPEQNHIPTWSLSSSSLAMMLSCRAARAARAQGAGLPPPMSVCAIFRVMFCSTMLIVQWSVISTWASSANIFNALATLDDRQPYIQMCNHYSGKVSVKSFVSSKLIWFYLYMQSGMSTFASRSKTGFKSYIPKLIMNLEVAHMYIWNALRRDPKKNIPKGTTGPRVEFCLTK